MGWFTVAEIPIAQWNGAAALAARAGQASPYSDGGPAALKRATQQHDSAPSSACSVHRGAVLHAGKLWNVTVSPLHAQRDRAANVSQLRLRLTTPFFGDASGIPVTAVPPPARMPRCERVKRGVLTAAAVSPPGQPRERAHRRTQAAAQRGALPRTGLERPDGAASVRRPVARRAGRYRAQC